MHKTPAFLHSYSLFREECRRQLMRMGLQGWDVKIEHRFLRGEDTGDAAHTIMEAENRIACITMNEAYTPTDPRRLAKHEVSHIFLEQLSYSAERRWASKDEWYNAIESACTVLEKII